MDFMIFWIYYVTGLVYLLSNIECLYHATIPKPRSPMMFMVQETRLNGSDIRTVCAGLKFSDNNTITFSKYNPAHGKFLKINTTKQPGKYRLARRRLQMFGVFVSGVELTINNADCDDGGIYLCTIEDGKQTETKTLPINVKVPPEIVEKEEEEEELTAALGKSYILECEARCFPPGKIIKWVDEFGNTINNSDKYRIEIIEEPKSITTELNIVTVDELIQKYTCIISNTHGTVTKTFTVTAQPFIEMIEPRESNYTVGQQISFRCDVNNILQDQNQILWKFQYKDSPPLMLNNRTDSEQRLKILTVAKSSTLTISDLLIWNAKFEDQGRYTCVHQHNGSEILASKFITVKGPPNITTTSETISTSIGESVKIVCDVTSRPISQVMWYRDNLQISDRILHVETTVDDIYVTSVLYIDLIRHLGTTYTCKARNNYGTVNLDISTVEKKTEDMPQTVNGTTVGVAVVLVILLVAVVSVVVAMLWKRRQRNEIPKMTPALSLIKRYNIHSSSNSVSLGYENDGLEIDDQEDFPRCRLKFKDRLGEGKFGKVLKAEALSICRSGKWETVAVKMWKDTATDGEKEDFYHELMIVKKISHHQNVVKFLGSSKAIGSDPVLMIMEFVSGGDLLRFLRTKRTYYNQKAVEENQQSLDATPDNIRSSEITVDSQKTSRPVQMIVQPDLSPKDLLCYSHQIAKGMSHIASLEIVHRDVAARNILISDNNICKVSDFGLARDVEGTDEYERTTKGPLPIRWMSPEALRDNVHSTKSDVWAYGVCLWEISTFGASPYPGKSVKMAMEAILSGTRLDCPGHCKQEFFDVMESCWTREPADRPSFTELVQTLEELLESEGEYMMLDNFNKDIYCVLDNNSEEKL